MSKESINNYNDLKIKLILYFLQAEVDELYNYISGLIKTELLIVKSYRKFSITTSFVLLIIPQQPPYFSQMFKLNCK